MGATLVSLLRNSSYRALEWNSERDFTGNKISMGFKRVLKFTSKASHNELSYKESWLIPIWKLCEKFVII